MQEACPTSVARLDRLAVSTERVLSAGVPAHTEHNPGLSDGPQSSYSVCSGVF